MNDISNIEFFYPAWMLILCLLLGGLYATFLYYREDKFDDSGPWLKTLLAFLRGTSIFLLASLLLMPVINAIKTQEETPTIIIAQDDSESIKLADNFDSTAYVQAYEQLYTSLSDRYNVVEWSYGDSIYYGRKLEFAYKETDISQVVKMARQQYKGRPLAGLILATDGLYNLGSNPIYDAENLNFPIIPIAMGDTSEIVDVRIAQVLYNKISYLNDEFVLQSDLIADGLGGQNVVATLQRVQGKNVKTLQSESVLIDEDDFFLPIEFNVKATSPGLIHLRVGVSVVDGEKNTKNNYKDIYINVLDTRKKILIAAHAPHPDLGAIKSLLSENENYEIDLKYPRSENVNLADYNLIINHNIPSKSGRESRYLGQIEKSEIPRLFIAGVNTDLNKLNRIQDVLEVTSRGQSNDVNAHFRKEFNLFDLRDESPSRFETYPPLQAPFGDFTLKPGASTIFDQVIGSVSTQYPLLSFAESSGTKQGVLLAEGFWRWKLYEYLDHKSHEHTRNLISKVVQYLSVTKDKQQFRVYPDEYLVNENEAVEFIGELYNDAYQPINNEDVRLSVFSENDDEYKFRMSPSNKIYKRNIGYLDPGEYTYRAETSLNGRRLNSNGSFSVKQIQKESAQLVADHRVLYNMAQKSAGKVFYPQSLETVSEWLSLQDTSKNVLYSYKSQIPLFSSLWLLGIILLLLVVEWFLRRFYGSY